MSKKELFCNYKYSSIFDKQTEKHMSLIASLCMLLFVSGATYRYNKMIKSIKRPARRVTRA